MKVFKYLFNKKGVAETYEIYKAVRALTPYAKSKYKGQWEDALDESFFHILENFDSSKGELEHYATRVVGTIFLNKNSKEVSNTEQTDICMDLQSAKEYTLVGKRDEVLDTDFNSCLRDMVSVLVKDFRFFASLSNKDRKCDYGKLFSKYSLGTIKEVQDYLTEKYKDEVSRILGYAKSVSIRDFNEDRYLSSVDEGLEYLESLNGIALIIRKKGYHTKKVFKIDIGEVLDNIIGLFYKDSSNYGLATIEGNPVYVSLSGNIVSTESELRDCIERELIGTLVSRTTLKVVHYGRGDIILFSSTKDTQCDVILPMFGKDYVVSFERIAVKEVL